MIISMHDTHLLTLFWIINRLQEISPFEVSSLLNDSSVKLYEYKFTHQKTYVGFSVACFNLHSNLNWEPSSICKSGAPTISDIASIDRTQKKEINNKC